MATGVPAAPSTLTTPALRLDKAGGWKLFLKTIGARAYPRVIGAQREKSWMFFEIFLPLLAVSAYVFVYRAIQAPEEYIGFVIVCGAMTAFWMNILWSMSSQLYWEKETGNLALYIMAPNSMMAILLGMAFGGLFMTSVRALVIFVVGSCSDYVLAPPPPGQGEAFEEAVAAACEAARDIARLGFDKAMTRRNAKARPPRPETPAGNILLAPGGKTGGSTTRKEARPHDDSEKV